MQIVVYDRRLKGISSFRVEVYCASAAGVIITPWMKRYFSPAVNVLLFARPNAFHWQKHLCERTAKQVPLDFSLATTWLRSI
jgi:hypothetical protein